jgi:hypothetical protein
VGRGDHPGEVRPEGWRARMIRRKHATEQKLALHAAVGLLCGLVQEKHHEKQREQRLPLHAAAGLEILQGSDTSRRTSQQGSTRLCKVPQVSTRFWHLATHVATGFPRFRKVPQGSERLTSPQGSTPMFSATFLCMNVHGRVLTN